jgi:hypothetical protein
MQAMTTDLTTFNPYKFQFLLCHDMTCLPFFDTMLDAIDSIDTMSVRGATKLSVAFHDQMEVWEIPSAKELSKKEKEALWYADPSDRDPSDRAGRNPFHLLLCRRPQPDEGEGEELLDEMREPSLPVSAVLSEQQNQREEGGWYDPEVIAKMYHRCSSYSQMIAQMKGVQDETEIREYISTEPPSSLGTNRRKSLFPSFLPRLKSRLKTE